MSPSKIAPAASTLDAARDYLRRGWRIVPVPRGQKGPCIRGWPDLQLAEPDLPTYFGNSENIGVVLGAASGGVVDIDLDAREALGAADFFLPHTAFVFGRTSKPRSHRIYVSEPSNSLARPKPGKFTAADGTTLVELRADGQQTVVPLSLHPSGEFYEFQSNGDPALVEGATLSRAVAHVAAAALVARHWPAKGQRHDAALSLEGMLVRGGWTGEQIKAFILAVATAGGDEELKDRLRGVDSTERRLAAGCTATGAPTLASVVGDAVVTKVRDWLGINDARGSIPTHASGWPDPAPLGDELLPVPVFDLQLLPPSLRPLVEDISDRMQAPADYAAAAAIVALAGSVNRRAAIIPKRQDASWTVVPNLWGAIVAPPGMMKSPILRAVTLPLTRIEEGWRIEFENEDGSFAVEKERAELRFQAWREQYKQAIKKNESAPIPPDTALRPPIQKRLILTDSTFEKLHAILADNPAGVLVIRDELTGWLSDLGRLGREGERAFFLQAWNGDGGFTVDRIGRGSIHVPAVCVSLLGNIQPSRLRSYLAEAIEGGPSDDGLFQRFQILVWPDLPRNWRLVDRSPNDAALRMGECILAFLANLSADAPVRMHFEQDAQALFFDWWTELEAKIRGDAGLAPTFIAHLSKYRSLMPSLAGLVELADRAASGEVLTHEVTISLEHAKQAAALCDYLETHAKRVYGSVISAETRSARELARHIRAGDLPSSFTTRAVYLKGWTGLDTPERVRPALGLLEEAGWVCRAETPSSSVGGRPSEVWIPNPKIGRRHAQ